MTPEITDPPFQAIAKAIAADPANADYTKRGVEPLFVRRAPNAKS